MHCPISLNLILSHASKSLRYLASRVREGDYFKTVLFEIVSLKQFTQRMVNYFMHLLDL